MLHTINHAPLTLQCLPTCSRVIWLSASQQDLGYSCDFPTIAMHAVATDAESSQRPCLYLQLDNGCDDGGAFGLGGGGSASSGNSASGSEDSEAEADELLPELRLIPAEESQREPLPVPQCPYGMSPQQACMSVNPPSKPTAGWLAGRRLHTLHVAGLLLHPALPPSLALPSCGASMPPFLPPPLPQSRHCFRRSARARSATQTPAVRAIASCCSHAYSQQFCTGLRSPITATNTVAATNTVTNHHQQHDLTITIIINTHHLAGLQTRRRGRGQASSTTKMKRWRVRHRAWPLAAAAMLKR